MSAFFQVWLKDNPSQNIKVNVPRISLIYQTQFLEPHVIKGKKFFKGTERSSLCNECCVYFVIFILHVS